MALKRVGALGMVSRARKIFGTFEKRAPGEMEEIQIELVTRIEQLD